MTVNTKRGYIRTGKLIVMPVVCIDVVANRRAKSTLTLDRCGREYVAKKT